MMLPDYILSLGKYKKIDVYHKFLALFIEQDNDDLSMWIMRRYGDEHSWSKFHQLGNRYCGDMWMSAPSDDEDMEALITDYQISITTDYHISVVEDLKDIKVMLRQDPCCDYVPDRSRSLLCLHKNLPTIRMHLKLCSFEPTDVNHYMGAFFESLALLDKGTSMSESVACSVSGLPRDDATEKIMEQVANGSQSPKWEAKKKNVKFFEYLASLIRKYLLFNRP